SVHLFNEWAVGCFDPSLRACPTEHLMRLFDRRESRPACNELVNLYGIVQRFEEISQPDPRDVSNSVAVEFYGIFREDMASVRCAETDESGMSRKADLHP